MILDDVKLKGFFSINAINASGDVVDSYNDDNMIMTAASITMNELFSNTPGSTFVNKISFGTEGHVGANALIPKTSVDGFVNTRDRMFSVSGSDNVAPTNINDVMPTLHLNDVLYIAASVPGYYKFINTALTAATGFTSNYTITDALVLNVTEWEFIGTIAPYAYDVNFNIATTNVDQVIGDPASNITESSAGAGSTVTVLKNATSTTFTVTLPSGAGNGQNLTWTSFTEASLHANGRIFSLKPFKSMLKDSSITLQIVWQISF